MIGSGKEAAADARVESQLPHEDEKRDGGQIVGDKDLVHAAADHVQSALNGGQHGKSHKTDHAHDKSHGHARGEENEHDRNAQKPDGGRTHDCLHWRT